MNKYKVYTAVTLVLFIAFSGGLIIDLNTPGSVTEVPVTLLKEVSQVFLPNTAFAQTVQDASIADVAEMSINSVVNISSTKVVRAQEGEQSSPFFDDPFFKRFFGPNFRNEMPREQRQKSLGSGVIVSDDGIILTNNHVVENAEELKVTLNDEREFKAEIVGTDPQSDLAVIRLKGDDIGGLKPLPLGDSDELRLGDVVLAIGNPFGLSHTVTMGIVSAKGRSRMGIVDYENFIQTDAAINPGNSGGALINLKGELVGINTAIVSRSGGYQGIGFAIPTNMAKGITDKLISDGRIVRGWLGVGIQEVTHEIADALDLDSNTGVLVSEVVEDSPAEISGITPGDIIVSVNEKEIDSTTRLRNLIAMLGVDENVTVTVLRDGKKKEIRVKLAERATNIQLASATRGKESSLDGLSLEPLDQSTRMKYEIPNTIKQGVVVTDVELGKAADEANLQPGDIILEANKKTVASVDAFLGEYGKQDNSILLYVYRNGNRFFTVLKK